MASVIIWIYLTYGIILNFFKSKLEKKSGFLTKKHNKTDSSVYFSIALSSARKEEGEKSNQIKALPGLIEIKL